MKKVKKKQCIKFNIKLIQGIISQQMNEPKSEYMIKIESMIHGNPSKVNARDSQMYEILNWNQREGNKIQNILQDDEEVIESKSILINQEDKTEKKNVKEKNREQEVEQKQKQGREKQNSLGIMKKGHKIKNQLNMYQEVKLKKSVSSEDDNSRDLGNTRDQVRKQYKSMKKLDPNNENERKMIEDRKARIKEFNILTRNLPNSAFTTYFGKPAFEAYGRGSSHYQKKSHNVMPHRGENYPHIAQSYDGALLKGKKTCNQNYIPRKPLGQGRKPAKTEIQGGDLIHLPLEKPDLINNVRFAEPESIAGNKGRIPSVSSTKVAKVTEKKVQKKMKAGKKKAKQKSTFAFNDGLKYMNIRSNLIQLLEEKKKKDSQLAYKVTECYPSNWQCGKNESAYGYTVPAGKKNYEGDRAQDIISQSK